jgi:hypothetical protein
MRNRSPAGNVLLKGTELRAGVFGVSAAVEGTERADPLTAETDRE